MTLDSSIPDGEALYLRDLAGRYMEIAGLPIMRDREAFYLKHKQMAGSP